MFFFVCWKYWKVPRHLQLLVKWEVVSPNSRYREFYHEIGNIEKCLFTYWLNNVKWGRWFLQIVDIHVGNFNMKLTGRWFPQIVDGHWESISNIYIYSKNCGVSLWTCSREISGDRVALFIFTYNYISWYNIDINNIYIYNLYKWYIYIYKYCVYPIRSTAPNRSTPPFLIAMCPWQNHWNCFNLQLNKS